jgi:hypothetical protein
MSRLAWLGAGLVAGVLGTLACGAWLALHMVDTAPAVRPAHRVLLDDGSMVWAVSTSAEDKVTADG